MSFLDNISKVSSHLEKSISAKQREIEREIEKYRKRNEGLSDEELKRKYNHTEGAEHAVIKKILIERGY